MKFVPAYVKLDNFGDKLNHLILNELFGDYFVDTNGVSVDETFERIKVFAIGSFLSRDMIAKFTSKNQAVLFGVGAGYADFQIKRTLGFGREFPATVVNKLLLPVSSLPVRTRGYAIYWVRGPLTARLLGLPNSTVLADAAYMLRQCSLLERYQSFKRNGIVVIPHYTAATNTVDFSEACEGIGFHYIDPREPVEQILGKIASAELVLTEALHGAVISDALRVPWIPFKTSEDVFEFKWADFLASIGYQYDPAKVRVRWDVHNFCGFHPKNMSKYLLNRMRSKVDRLFVQPKDTAYDLLIASGRPPILSSHEFIESVDSNICSQIQKFREDAESNRVFT